MIQIEFHGAAKTVTGSNYLVRTDHGNFLVDCGMFQGPEVEYKNLENFDYDPSEINFVILSHAHIDHSGMLPKLYRGGFRGKIFATQHTTQIASLLLMDSAKIQENNFQEGRNYGKFIDKVAIVFNSFHAEETLTLFESKHFDEEFSPLPGIRVKFIRAGHILGAASIEVDIDDGGHEKEILFSGDIGRENQSLIDIFDKNYKSSPDYILVESLYGGEYHPDRQESADEMIRIIKDTVSKGGNVFIPSFSVHRTQEVLHDIKTAQEAGKLSSDLPVYLDSPLAQRVSQIYTAALQNREDSIFTFKSLRYVKKHKQSEGLALGRGQVILAGSGMADGGRILNHLATGLRNDKNAVIFVGYQAEGTLGREIVEGAKTVTIANTNIPVNAAIHHLHGFSGHGDTNDYINWIKRFNTERLKKVFLIHSEEDRAKKLIVEFEKLGIKGSYIPSLGEKVQNL